MGRNTSETLVRVVSINVLFQYPWGQNGWRIHSRRGRFTYRVPKPLHRSCTHVLCWTIIGLPKFEQTQFFVMVKKPHVVSTTNLPSRTSNPGLQFQVMETLFKVSNSDLRANRKIKERSTTSIPHHESVCFLGGFGSHGMHPHLRNHHLGTYFLELYQRILCWSEIIMVHWTTSLYPIHSSIYWRKGDYPPEEFCNFPIYVVYLLYIISRINSKFGYMRIYPSVFYRSSLDFHHGIHHGAKYC